MSMAWRWLNSCTSELLLSRHALRAVAGGRSIRALAPSLYSRTRLKGCDNSEGALAYPSFTACFATGGSAACCFRFLFALRASGIK